MPEKPQPTYELWYQNVEPLGWTCHAKGMNEEDARLTAKAEGFTKKQFEKLVNHKSKKFNFIKKKPKEWWIIEINLIKKHSK